MDCSAGKKAADLNVKFGPEFEHSLGSVDKLQESMDSASISDSATQVSMARMREEFRRILISISPAVKCSRAQSQSDPSTTYTDSEYSWYSQEGMMNRNSKAVPDEAMDSLRAIATQMIAAGYSGECIYIYKSVRKTGLDEMLKLLGIEGTSSKNLQRLEWQDQQVKIQRWIYGAEICFRNLFPGERALTDQIFDGLGTNNIADDCFMKTVTDSAIKLFNFVEAISSSRRSPKKLFKILDLYDVLSHLLPDIETIFGSKSGELFRKQAVEIRSSLSEAAREILSEFEKAVFGDLSTLPIPGGTVHPSTIYVMDYISLLAEYKQTLIELIVSKPSTISIRQDLDFSESEQQASPLVLHFVWITRILTFNLKAKSKHYQDASLAHFFMMNNIHCIVRKIKESVKLREMIGDDYLNKLTDEYNLAATDYLRTSWKRVLDCLKNDGLQKLGSFLSGNLSKFVVRQRFKAFNAKFKGVLTNQATWFVADVQLRERLKTSILQVLIEVYTSFLERHRRYIWSEKHPENYMKYSPEDVEKAVMNLFEDY